MPGKSGCPVYRGEILLISYFGTREKIILPVNRGPTVATKSPTTIRPTAAELLRHRLMINLDPDGILGYLVARTKEAVRRLDNKNYRAARKIFMLNEGVSVH